MAGGLRYETGRDMPPGMAEKVAVQLVRQMAAAAPVEETAPLSVAGCEETKRTIDTVELQDLKEALEWDKDEFPEVLKEYTGIVAKPYTAFQYYYENGDYIGDSETFSLEELLEEAKIEVAE